LLDLRILHVYRTYFPDPPGGLQEAIRQICLSTQKFGIQNTIFTLSPHPIPSVIDRSEGRVVRCKSWASPASCDLGALSSFKTFTELSARADLIHYHFPWPFADVLQLLSGSKTPALMTYHSDVVRQRLAGKFYLPLMNRMLDSMRAIVATSQAYAETSTTLSDQKLADRLKVIPLGMCDESRLPAQNENFLKRFETASFGPYFLFVGVLRYYKGIDFLLKAAKEVKANIIVAGSGPEERSLKKLADELRLRNIIFLGAISNNEKVRLLKNCVALVLPSHLRSEAFGMVLVESAMYGKPMISCEIGTGTSYVNRHNETGLVVRPRSPGELVGAMNVLLEDDRMREDFGLGARERYENLFSGPALGKAYFDLYIQTKSQQTFGSTSHES